MLHATIFPDPDAEDYVHQDFGFLTVPHTVAHIPMKDGSAIDIRLEPDDRLILMHDCRRAELGSILRMLDHARQLCDSDRARCMIADAQNSLETMFKGVKL